MAVDALVERDQIVCDLRDALRDTTSGLAYAPRLIRKVLETGAWSERYDRATHKAVPFSTFLEFVETEPTEGLGASVDLVRRLVAEDMVALDLLDRALQNPAGHPTVSNIHSRPAGTTEDAALRRLRKDRPDLHADVLAGKLKAHTAMVEAGFRPRTVSVPIERPETVARTLRKHMTAADLAHLSELLTGEV